MPDDQYSFYLHCDDRTDIAAMFQTDARLPALIPVFFDGHLSAMMALVSGTWSSLSGLPDELDGGVAALAMSPDTEYQRRRYTLTLLDDRSSERVERVLTGGIALAWRAAEKPDYHRSGPAYDRTGAAASAGQHVGNARHGQRAAGSGSADGRYGWRE